MTLQTTYRPGRYPGDPSCYGRGTTDADVRARNITLGFHESCHRSDFESYLKAHPLPLPDIGLGLTEAHCKAAMKAFEDALDAYFAASYAFSGVQTDEVGFTRSQATRTKRCFEHVLPP